MKNRRLAKKCVSLLLSFALILTLAPMTAFAAEMPWASDAVNKLNSIYGGGTFSADDTVVTVEAMKELLTGAFSYEETDQIVTDLLGSGTDLSRLQMARIACDLFGLAENLSAGEFTDCGDPAAITLRSLGIITGKGDGSFAPESTVTNAELAVIFYRALGKAGAGSGTVLEGLKPGAYGYDEIMYLATRGCVPFDINPMAQLSSSTIVIRDGENSYNYTGKEEIWNMWCGRLAHLPPESGRTVNWTAYDEGPVASAQTILDAAVIIVAEDRESLNNDEIEGIFSDVSPSSWFYDGVMYLFNKGLVVGTGTGEFKPNDEMTREQLAILLCRINDIDTTSPAGITINDIDATSPAGITIDDFDQISVWARNSVTHVLDRGYMVYTSGANFSPRALITRQEAALAVFKSYGQYADGAVNLAILNRFSDSADIGGAYSAAMAYMVSAGVLRGDGEERLAPTGGINRAGFSTFLARVMMGLDTSKMHDYETALMEVLQ